jgi:hypothetical protein
VLILVLTVDQEPWRTIEIQGQRATWAATVDDELPIFWLHGRTRGLMRMLVRAGDKAIEIIGSGAALARFHRLTGVWAVGRPVRQEGNVVFTGVPETYLNTNPKTIAGLRHVLEKYDFDYLLRTNTSTYVNRQLLADFVVNLPEERYYGGFLGESGNVRYASGTCTLLSRDAVEMIVSDPQWEYDIIDDIAIGKSMERAGVDIQPFDRIDVLTSEHINNLTIDTLRSAFVVRCKGAHGREHDIVAMHRVHELYRDAGLA